MRACKVVGCPKNAEKRGLCGAHYFRLRKHGNPTGGRAPNGAGLAFIASLASADTDECIYWPYGTNGNGYGKVSGKKYAHRLACEATHGPAPAGKPDAAHTCGRGHLGCVNPRHLRWASEKENAADMVGHGTANRGTRSSFAKLTEAEATEIKKLLRSGAEKPALARRFEVSLASINNIAAGRAWAWLMVEP